VSGARGAVADPCRRSRTWQRNRSRIRDKVVVVTGASSGIGAALARLLGARGRG